LRSTSSGELAFYKYSRLIYVCAVVDDKPRIFDAIPVEIVSPAVAEAFKK
jgi:hypothetical protein